jgi:hypothetical protein
MNIEQDKTEITYKNYKFLKEYKPNGISDEAFLSDVLEEFQLDSDCVEKLVEENICPQCGRELGNKTQGYDSYEYHGEEFKERVSNSYCENCNITYNE